ncbi:MAG: hypothetical protein LBF95_01500 [Treponema sp.]|jgi:hypothetical protein|nr:hypothetical protein [Treponema sp.]
MYNLCSQILKREAGLLETVGKTQQRVWNAVVKREWTGFEALLLTMDRTAAELEELEGERKALFRDLPGFSAGEDHETGFYRFITSLPPDEHQVLAAAYRELKMASLRIRINNENLLSYLSGIKATMSAFIESAFPDRKGRLYSRSGTVRPQDMRCMVLNRSL